MKPGQAEITQHNPQQYTISGAVDFNTAPELMRRALRFFSKTAASENEVSDGKVKVDLSEIAECNSAGLALMFEMVKHAQANNVNLLFQNLPDTLLTIAKAYGVEAEVQKISE